jgi:hypothetical protein
MWNLSVLKRLFPWPEVSQLEAWLLRVMFGYALVYFLPPGMTQTTQHAPVGLAHFFELTWLSDAGSYAVYRHAFLILVFAYVSGVALPVVLPLLTLLHALPYTLLNSQGHPHHGYQVITLTLGGLAVAAVGTARWRKPRLAVGIVVLGAFATARFYAWWSASGMMSSVSQWAAAHLDSTNAARLTTLVGFAGFFVLAVMLKHFSAPALKAESGPDDRTNGWQLIAGQTAIAAAYLTSVFSKLINSGGAWFANSHNVAIDFVKTTRQSFYSKLDPALQFDPPGVKLLLENEWLAKAFFSSGVVLEAVLFIAIGTRKLALVFGIFVFAMHRSIMELMTLTFHTNEAAVALFYINLPFWIAAVAQRRTLR